MRSTLTAMAAVLTAGALSSPSFAQYATPTPAAPVASTKTVTSVSELCPTKVTKGAQKPLLDLQTAVVAKDATAFATALVAARAAARSPVDRCILAQLEMNGAANRNDYVAASAALEALASTGVGNTGQLLALTDTLGKLRYNAKDYAGAAAMFERGIKLAPNDSEQYILLGETRAKTGQLDAALDLFRKGIAMQTAAGGKIKEDYLKHAVALAYDAKSPQAVSLTREWVSAYPNPKNWRDALKIYTIVGAAPNADLLDVYRLQRATKSLAGEADFGRYAQAALSKGLIGEGMAVLDEGVASNAISATSPAIKSLRTQGAGKVTADRASLAGAAAKALAGTLAKPAQVTADALYGYGDYAKAATLYRAALGKTGADASQLNLRLGSALALSGDKAGAKAAFDLVTGPRAEVAKYWLIYLAQRP
ncbi:MAG: hypothetical protein ABIT69_01990 [Sphingomicrobium sp.]